MNLRPFTQRPLAFGLASLVTLVTLTSCGFSSREVEPQTTATSIDTQAIVEQVLDRVTTRLGAMTTPVPVALGQTTAIASSDLEQELVTLYQRANPAVVYIIVPGVGSGSGFVYDDAGHIVTNNHVVDGGRRFEIVFADGERRSGELVGRDVDSDLAVLKVDDLPSGLEPLPVAASDDVAVGQFVVAIGNPFGEQGSMSLGIVSGLDRSLRSSRGAAQSAFSLPQVLQTDAPINPGNSGGPLLNLAGEVVGVNSAIATETGANSGVGFSIPAAAVRRIVPSLISDGGYEYPYMGVSFADEISLTEQEMYDLPQTSGAYVLAVTPGGPADRAGLAAANGNTGRNGDLIVAIDGQPIADFSDLNSYLAFHTSVGQTITVTVLRNGEQVDLSLTLGQRP